MSALRAKTREMLASRKPMPRAVPQPHGAGMPVAVSCETHAPAAGALAAAIAALEADMHEHQRKAGEARALLGRLRAYANGSAEPSAPEIAAAEPSAPTNGRKRPSLDDETRRRRQRDSMRKYRAAAKAATPPPKPPKSRKRRKAAAAEEPPPIADPPAEVAPPPPPAVADDAVVAAPPPSVAEPPDEEARNKRAARNLRRKLQRAQRLGHEFTTTEQVLGCKFNQAPTTLTEWATDPATGVLSRERITAGEPVPLRGERTELLQT